MAELKIRGIKESKLIKLKELAKRNNYPSLNAYLLEKMEELAEEIEVVEYRKKYLVDINKQYELNLSILKYFILGALTISNKDKKIIENNLTIDEIKYYKKGNNILSFYNLKKAIL